MGLSSEQDQVRERFLMALVEATLPLKGGPDPELTLELLIQAAALLQEHLESELEELRQEQAE